MGYYQNRIQNLMHAQEWKKHVIDMYSEPIRNSIANSVVHDFTICNNHPFGPDKINGPDTYIKYEGNQFDPDGTLQRFDHTFVEFMKYTTTDALFELPIKFPKENGKIAVLNFASFKNPGGKFIDGSSAQEESLCHESTLYPVLLGNIDFYLDNCKKLNNGLYAHRVLYTPDIIFERCDQLIGVDVITCAFPNLGEISRRCMRLDTEYYKTVISHRIMAIMDSGLIHGVDTIILGAIGCGVFKNDPNMVALAFSEVIHKYYLNTYKRIVFAIPDEKTYNIFTQSV